MGWKGTKSERIAKKRPAGCFYGGQSSSQLSIEEYAKRERKCRVCNTDVRTTVIERENMQHGSSNERVYRQKFMAGSTKSGIPFVRVCICLIIIVRDWTDKVYRELRFFGVTLGE